MARHRHAFVGAAALIALAALLLLPAVAASLYQFYDGVADPPPDYPTGGSGVSVFRNAWAAQSLDAGANYTLARVDLWAAANSPSGSGATLVVTADAAGSPDLAAPPLATAAATAPSSYGWVSFNVAPNVGLTQGALYWIVLESNASSGSQGWTWWNAGNETVIPGGQGEVSSGSGSAWTAAGGDFEVRTFGYREAQLSVAVSSNDLLPRAGDTVTLNIWFNNTGTVPSATVWINETAPPGLSLLSDNASAVNGVRTGTSNWTFADVGPGVHYFYAALSVSGGVANHSYLVDRVTLAYTDFRGLPMPGSSASVTLTVTAVAAAAGGGGLIPTIVSAALAGWVLLVALWPRGKLEEAFLVDYNGVLIAHLTRTATAFPDRDIFAGMLTAVQEFIRVSFTRAGGGDLRHLDFGHRKIFIRRGEHAFLAVVIRGRTPPTLRRKMARTLARVEAAYGKALVRWSGDMSEVEGSAEALSAELLS